ncbi:MAG: hypothetical protein IJ838_04935 [Paludibacteraceae bacterium]|nr:hypothetical protein [Paludibacteraceae bacterium]
MKSRILLLLLMATASFAATSVRADETITVSATNADISENLDLRAVATLFGEVDNLEQFEQELNSEQRHLNNLDLNGDGIVDYLRVVEIGEGENRLIVLQAVLAKDIYQDVASIYIERQADQTVSVQVVGDTYLYGESYIIEPVYLYRPVIYDWFWGPTWVAWHSPYYWGFYYPHYVAYSPWVWDRYYAHIHYYHHHHPRCSYHYAHNPRPGMHSLRGSHQAERIIRNDWAKANPGHAFTARAASRGSKATNARQMHNETRATMASRNANHSASSNNHSARRGTSANTASTQRAEGPRQSSVSRTPAQARESAAQRTFGSTNTRQSTRVTANSRNTVSTANANNVSSRNSRTSNTAAQTTRSSATTSTRSSGTQSTRSSASSSSSNGVRPAASSSTRTSTMSQRSSSTSSGSTYRAPASSSRSYGVSSSSRSSSSGGGSNGGARSSRR